MKHFIQSGRSMVEMLGVLVIIGLMSMGAVVGYNYAVTKYKAVETINEIKLRAVVCSEQMLKEQTLNFDEMGYQTRFGYKAAARPVYLHPDYFEISLNGVNSAVCRKILDLSWTLPATVSVGLEDYTGNLDICGEEENSSEIYFVFKADLTEGSTIKPAEKPQQTRCYYDSDCKCGTCVEGVCESYCPASSKCVKSYEDARYYSCCLNENVVGDFCCSTVFNGKCCNSAGNCCPAETPLQDKDGKCYACDLNGGVNVTGVTDNCYVCPKRVAYNSNSWIACALPCDLPGTSTEGKPIMNYGGTCYKCDEVNGPLSLSYTLTKECSICPNRRTYWGWNGNSLVLTDGCAVKCDPNSNKPLLGTDGYCHECTYAAGIPIQNLDKDCSTICPNRHVGGYNASVGSDTFCILNDCPLETPLQGVDGKCYACDHIDGVEVTGSPKNCSVCDTSKTPRQVYQMGPYAICAMPCDVAGTPTAEKPLQINSSISFISGKGRCVGCNESVNAKVADRSICDLCPGRVWLPGYQYANCILSTCAGNTPLLRETDYGGWMLECKSCDYDGRILNSALTDTCENVCPGMRVAQGDYCILAHCDGFRDTSNACHTCDELAPVVSTANECQKCPQRKHEGDRCKYPCGTSLASDKPLTSYDGTCYSCDTTVPVNTSKEQCNGCENRVWENNSCQLSSCSKQNPLKGLDDNCYPCDYALPVKTDKDSCGVCRNRVYKEGQCEMP